MTVRRHPGGPSSLIRPPRALQAHLDGDGTPTPCRTVTGHASPKMLKKYIKADSLEVVEKLTDKYEYFR